MPFFVDVFSELHNFRAGCLKFRSSSSKEDEGPPKPYFIPCFPYLYENICNGNLIMDAPGKVQLKLMRKTTR